MSLQLIAGRAGSGKTEHCLTAVVNELSHSMTDGPTLLVLTPEQATLQTERQILARTQMQALGRCEVLSFTRLAYRIFASSPGTIPITLTETGRQMAVRYLLGKHHGAFDEFGRIGGSGNFVREASSTLGELFREAVSLERLDACARQAKDESDPSAGRLHDLALLFRAYCEYLGDERVDPDGVLALAKDRLASTQWLTGARVWIDGFASFSQQQAQLLVALAQLASHTAVALLVDPSIDDMPTDPNSIDDSDLFYKTRWAWIDLVKAAVESGIAIEKPLRLSPLPPPRFASAARLARLEAETFDATKHQHTGDSAPKDDVDIQLAESPDLRTEVRAVARCILDLTRRDANPLRLRDIAIVVRDLEPYHDILSAEFTRHGIAYFLDRRRPIHHHPLVEIMRGLIALIGGGRVEDSLMRMIKSGLTPLLQAQGDALENYLLARNHSDAASWNQPWTGKPPGFRSSQTKAARAQMAVIESARASLRDVLGNWWPGVPGKMTGQEWATELISVLDRLGVSESLARWALDAQESGQHDLANEHERVWAEVVELLEEFVDALRDVSLTARRMRETIEAGLAELALGLVPATLDQVVISNIDRGRQPMGIKATFILGFADGLWSGRPHHDSLLGDEERDRLEAARPGKNRQDRMAEERMLTYVALTRASEFLWISRPGLDDKGRKLEAATYWPDIERVLGDSVGVRKLSRDGELATANDLAATVAEAAGHLIRREAVAAPHQHSNWQAIYNWVREKQEDTQHHDSSTSRMDSETKYQSPPERLKTAVRRALQGARSISAERVTALENELVMKLWPVPHRSSITRLEQFARCPFQHFARYGLPLVPRETRELNQIHWGNFFHKALEQFANDLLSRGDRLDEVDDHELADRAETICTRVLPDFLADQQLDDVQGQILKRRGAPYLARFLRWQQQLLGTAQFAPRDAEVAFGHGANAKWPALSIESPDGHVIQIDGKIDRLDLTTAIDDQWAVVFDYKTSAEGRFLRLDEIYHGLALQLLAYLLAVKDHLAVAGGKVRLGGAFLSTVLASPEKVEHPSEANESGFDAFKKFKPRGIVDFDAIPALDQNADGHSSSIFQVKQKKGKHEISDINKSDAVEPGALDDILKFVRAKLGQLADRWLDGDIDVAPLRHGKKLPCEYCDYRSVCRFEYRPEQMRFAEVMTRTEAIKKMQAGANGNSESPA